MRIEGKRVRGRPRLRWKDNVGRDMEDGKLREEWAQGEIERTLQYVLLRRGIQRRKLRFCTKKITKILQQLEMTAKHDALFHYTVRRDMKAWKIREEWVTDEEKWKVSARPATPHRYTAAKGEKVEILH